MPVHKWLVRHVYFPSLRLGMGKGGATFVVFLFSAIFHELVVGLPLHVFRLWAFVGIMMQLPLISLTTFVKNKLKSDQVRESMGYDVYIYIYMCVCMCLCVSAVWIRSYFRLTERNSRLGCLCRLLLVRNAPSSSLGFLSRWATTSSGSPFASLVSRHVFCFITMTLSKRVRCNPSYRKHLSPPQAQPCPGIRPPRWTPWHSTFSRASTRNSDS